jgi:hypothetical protein
MSARSSTTTRLDLLLAQYDTSFEIFRERLDGLTDDEFFWEPVSGCWSLRRSGDSVTPHAFGKGPWLLDNDRSEPDPAPLTTIAWRLCHLVAGQMERHDYTFGAKALTEDAIAFPNGAAEALAWLDRSHAAWRGGLGQLRDADLDTVGLSSYPHGRDPHLPFGDILWWTNRELIHHGAEIALLRDLWRFRA